MSEERIIPIFPLNILPLPTELIPLHIFEPRYRQLLQDMESEDIEFGILYAAPINADRVGALVKLESILKRYSTGESDIVVKCNGTFILDKYYKHFKDKQYAGGRIITIDAPSSDYASDELKNAYREYQEVAESSYDSAVTIHDIANSLNLENSDRLKYLRLIAKEKKERFLKERLRFDKYILEQERKYKNSFTLN
ncbi:LON peptidase substrate-binding domain-containing protein [Fulvivirga lutea]|uniref:LON peptidase substrate-binding domain-containing protein n=1 Tax=Fulvivirga lutea TaxID=2810512 RepID=A0A974WII8_9BACT|nr:LON peptidase substrate-binding domain-containing protein [Fulvivirga lutea]QSE95988.1 LON peptidase substrate-binding domain-containing protein [Fulvivirga lutea]